jgi:hypothetical protein
MLFSKTQIYIIGGILLFLFALGYFFYRKGKSQVTLQYGPGELPGNPSSGTQLGASNEEIKKIAGDLYNDMEGLNILGHSLGPYKAAILLNDNDIIKLYNTFNAQYQKSSGQTLTQWIESEAFSSTFEAPAYTLHDRLRKLNLY